MREIKFRGQRVDTNEWVYGSLLISEPEGKLEPLHYFICAIDKGMYRVKSDTIGQYTGLKDKEGTEIYEGDIIKARDVKVDGQDRLYICEVVWMPSGWHAMRYKDKMGKEHYLSINILETEIIGNIYENPELLELN